MVDARTLVDSVREARALVEANEALEQLRAEKGEAHVTMKNLSAEYTDLVRREAELVRVIGCHVDCVTGVKPARGFWSCQVSLFWKQPSSWLRAIVRR